MCCPVSPHGSQWNGAVGRRWPIFPPCSSPFLLEYQGPSFIWTPGCWNDCIPQSSFLPSGACDKFCPKVCRPNSSASRKGPLKRDKEPHCALYSFQLAGNWIYWLELGSHTGP